MVYTKDEKVVDRVLGSASSDLDEFGQAYELESKKSRITINQPFQIRIAVYQRRHGEPQALCYKLRLFSADVMCLYQD